MAQYPGSTASFTTKVNGDTIDASHVNDLQAEVTALTDALLNGLAHVLKPNGARDLGTTGSRWRHLFLSGDATIAGDVTAAAFIGDGSGLTNVSTVADLDDLGDVVLTTPTNGQFLKFDGANWINDDLPGGGAPSYLDDLLDVDAASPAVGDLLQWDGVNWTPASLSGFRTGDIKWSFQPTPEAGWLEYNGQAVSRTTYAALFALHGTTYGVGNGTTTFNLPNMSRRVPLGAAPSGAQSTIGEVGGSFDHTHAIPAHQHGVGTLAVASHNHGTGTLAVESHTHAPGTLAVASHTHAAGSLLMPNHTHTPTNLTVGAAGGHGHSLTGATAPGGDHTHNVDAGSADAQASGGFFVGESGNKVTDGSGDHTHGAGSLAAVAVADHAHSLTGAVDGSGTAAISGSTAAATPGLTGTSAATQPNVSGNTGSTAPALSGQTAASAVDTSGGNNQAYMVLRCYGKT